MATRIIAKCPDTSWGRIATRLAADLKADLWFSDPKHAPALPAPPADQATTELVVGDPWWASRLFQQGIGAIMSMRSLVRPILYTALESPRLWRPPSQLWDCPIYVPSRFSEHALAGEGIPCAGRIAPDLHREFYRKPHLRPADGVIRIGIGGATQGAGGRKRLYNAVRMFAERIDLLDLAFLDVRVDVRPAWASRFNRKNIGFLVGDRMEYATQAAWYDSLDAFLSVSMGEGYDLMVAEALARGLPVAAPDWSASAEHPLTIRLPYKLGWMKEFAPFYSDQCMGAVVSDSDIGSAIDALMLAARKRQGTRVVLNPPTHNSAHYWRQCILNHEQASA